MSEFQVSGTNAAALFTFKLHRGDGMCLLAMNWKKGKPPKDFVGFAIEYKEPGGVKFFALKNRLAFPGAAGAEKGSGVELKSGQAEKLLQLTGPAVRHCAVQRLSRRPDCGA